MGKVLGFSSLAIIIISGVFLAISISYNSLGGIVVSAPFLGMGIIIAMISPFIYEGAMVCRCGHHKDLHEDDVGWGISVPCREYTCRCGVFTLDRGEK